MRIDTDTALTMLKIAGVLIVLATIIFEDYRRRRDAESRAQAALAEAERDRRINRNVLLAGQPLRSLDLTWEFPNVPDDVVEMLRTRTPQEERVRTLLDITMHRPPVLLSAYERYFRIYPWLSWMALGRFGRPDFSPDDPVVLLIALDESGSVVLEL